MKQHMVRKRMTVAINPLIALFLVTIGLAPDGIRMAYAEESQLPWLIAFPENEAVEGWEWPLGASVHLAIDDPVTVVEPDFEADGVMILPDWGDPRPYVRFDFPGDYDMKVGDIVTLTDSVTPKTHTVLNLSVTTANAVTDAVGGFADPSAVVSTWSHGFDEFLVQGTAGADGAWVADFTTVGFDLVEGMGGRAQVQDNDGNATAIDWNILNPHFIVFPEWEWFDGVEWPDGATVTITVAGKPECEVAKESWGGFFNGNFGEGCDLEIGDVVTFTDGDTTRTHTVQNLDVTAVDEDANTVEGTADEGAEIFVWPHATGETIQVTVDASGTWSVDFTGVFDLEPGECGRSEIRDEAGNATAVDWCTPNPRLVVSITDDWIQIEQFPMDAVLTLSIYASPGGELLWQEERVTDGDGNAFVGPWETEVDLKPGMHVIVESEAASKDIVLETVLLFILDTEADFLAGSAPPERHVWVGTGNDSYGCGMDVDSDAGGYWEADFASQPCDVTDDMWAAAQVFDEDGDATEANPGFPRGYHDYDTGDVPSWACNAGGWVFDPDEKDRPVQVRILSDGEVAFELGTNGDGDVGYEAHLWDLISSYETHEVTVEAYDQESDTWRRLEGTPRPLTCRTYDIYIFDTATRESRPITTMRDTDEYNARWSPDGKKIVHHVWDFATGEKSGMYITDVATGESALLVGAEGGSFPAWSPNSLWVAFSLDRGKGTGVYVVPSTGGDPKLVRNDAFMPTWAPNSQRIAFHQPSDGSIRTVDLKRGVETLVVAEGNGPDWSPNGQWIAYEVGGDLWKIRVDILGRPLGDPIQLTNDFGYEGRPTWSVDSKTIAYHHGFDDRDTDIWTISAAGGMPTWLTGAPGFADYDPYYSKTGRSLAYASFSPAGQAERLWVAAYTYDPPAGAFGEGTHPYHFEFEWSVPESGNFSGQGGELDVSPEAPLYDGYVLLRGPMELRGVETAEGFVCEEVAEIHPDQPVRFLAGWLPDYGEMTYREAEQHFNSVAGNAVWDVGLSAGLERHEIRPFSWSNLDPWFQSVCSYTLRETLFSIQSYDVGGAIYLPLLTSGG